MKQFELIWPMIVDLANESYRESDRTGSVYLHSAKPLYSIHFDLRSWRQPDIFTVTRVSRVLWCCWLYFYLWYLDMYYFPWAICVVWLCIYWVTVQNRYDPLFDKYTNGM